jgi:hypothetical protein
VTERQLGKLKTNKDLKLYSAKAEDNKKKMSENKSKVHVCRTKCNEIKENIKKIRQH